MFERYFLWATIAALAIGVTNRAIGQPVGDRVGDTCRVIAVDDRTDLHLYTRPTLEAALPDSGAIADRDDANRIVQLFDRERIAAHGFDLGGVDGDPNLWHEIEDSIGNRGYMLAIDPATGLSTLRYCD